MQRIRTVRPEFFKSRSLFDAERASGLPVRLAAAAILTLADSEGRFEWQPERLTMTMLPLDWRNGLDPELLFAELTLCNFVHCYRVGDRHYGRVVNWHRYQILPQAEPSSALPPPPDQLDEGVRRAQVAQQATFFAGGVGLPESVKAACTVAFPCKGGFEWSASLDDVLRWYKLYMNLDLQREFTVAYNWLRDHPSKLKTPRGMRAFLGSWLKRSAASKPAAVAVPAGRRAEDF